MMYVQWLALSPHSKKVQCEWLSVSMYPPCDKLATSPWCTHVLLNVSCDWFQPPCIWKYCIFYIMVNKFFGKTKSNNDPSNKHCLHLRRLK